MSNFRLEGNKVVTLTDLDAELYTCTKCGTEDVLMFNWCKTCRERFEEEFEDINPILKTIKD